MAPLPGNLFKCNLINGICLNCTYGDGKPFTCCECEGPLYGGFCSFCASIDGNSFTYDPTLYSYNDSPNFINPPPPPHTYSCELYGNDYHYGPDCLPRFPLVFDQEPCYNQNFSDNHYPQNSQSFPQQYLCCANCRGPHESFQWNEELNTNPEKESDEFIKYSVEDLVPIPSESEDTPRSDSECILPSCDDFSPINIFEEESVTFSNPLLNLNDDFTSSDDELLSDEDVSEDNVKIYSNPLFEFDDEYISSDVNPLFDEVLEDIECKDSYDSNLDESTFLVTPLFDSNEDEYFTPGDDVELLLHRDPSTPIMSVVSILEGFTDEPPLEENGDLFDLESKENDWKKILYDAPIYDLMSEDKVLDLGICVKNFSSTYVSLPFEDRPYFFFTYVV
uniref:Pre-mRNA splicing Prp18-interacting factor n=1 Tax=Tanacetum cinerariifolium TaxID=118510 RepID=A0A6L2L347_TANCI|nr:hypothetical protein [Tanacetum cinerariifolium]